MLTLWTLNCINTKGELRSFQLHLELTSVNIDKIKLFSLNWNWQNSKIQQQKVEQEWVVPQDEGRDAVKQRGKEISWDCWRSVREKRWKQHLNTWWAWEQGQTWLQIQVCVWVGGEGSWGKAGRGCSRKGVRKKSWEVGRRSGRQGGKKISLLLAYCFMGYYESKERKKNTETIKCFPNSFTFLCIFFIQTLKISFLNIHSNG